MASGDKKQWPKHNVPATSFRLTPEARRLLAAMAEKRGVSQGAILEQLIRDEAERRNITAPQANESD